MTKGAFMPYRNNRNYEIWTCKKRSHPRRTHNYNLWTSYGLYHVTVAPHAETEKNGGALKKSYYCSKKGQIDTHLDTII